MTGVRSTSRVRGSFATRAERGTFRGRIEDWATRREPYEAPELAPRISGRTSDGKYILTSGIVRAVGRCVWTESGSVYELGDAIPAFVAWLRENGVAFDPDDPIAKVSVFSRLPPPKGDGHG